MEAWFTLMAEAARGVQGAQAALQSLSKVSKPADLSRWMLTFMPGLASSAGPQPAEIFEQWLEEWWRMIGVVPRARYLELLEKHDALRRQLEKAQQTIRNMQETLDRKGQESYAKNVLGTWNAMLDETLKAQVEWLKAWKTPGEGKEKSSDQGDKVGGEKGS